MSATARASGSLKSAWTAGSEAATTDDVSLADAIAVEVGETSTRARNLAAGAMTLLLTLMIVLLAALIGGEFASAIPSNSVFSDAINTTTNNAGTAFVIFGVSLLAIPTVAVLSYMVSRLGGFVGFSAGSIRRR